MTSAVSGDSIKMQEGMFNPSLEWQFNASAHINTFSMTFTEMAVVSLLVSALKSDLKRQEGQNCKMGHLKCPSHKQHDKITS